MVDITFYLATEAIARRTGVIESRHRTKDGRFILDNKDLSNIRFTPDEYIDGLSGIEKINKQQAMILIKENNYAKGAVVNVSHVEEVEQPTNEPETVEVLTENGEVFDTAQVSTNEEASTEEKSSDEAETTESEEETNDNEEEE